MKALQFTCSKDESKLASQIASRAVGMAQKNGVKYDYMTAYMDIEACHSNGCPLRLAELLEADDANFGHDVFGIRRYINRTTGELEDFFVPRCAQPQHALQAA